MESSVPTPSVKPPGAKQTAKRTNNFKPWAGMGSRNAATMSPTLTSPQNPSPPKITSDVSSGINGAAAKLSNGHHGASPTSVLGESHRGAGTYSQTPAPSGTPTMSKNGGLSMSGRIQAAQKRWEAKRPSQLAELSIEGPDELEIIRSRSHEGSPAVESAQRSKPPKESPVPLPSYGQGLASKRSATDMNSVLETPMSKRQQINYVTNGSEHPSFTSVFTSVATPFSPTTRSIDVDGRMMEIIESTSNRKYNEIWVPSLSGDGTRLITDRGAIFPSEYKLHDTNAMPWVCPVRDCQKRMRDVRGLGGHLSASHNSLAFNDNGDGTLSLVGPYKKTEKSAPPVVVSCEPIARDAPPPRNPWSISALAREKPKPKPLSTQPFARRSTTQLPEVIEYLHQFLSSKQKAHTREDIDYMRKLPRQRDLPEGWLKQHECEVLDHGHYTSALAYLVGEEVFGADKCRQNETRSTSRLSDEGRCIRLPSNMPREVRSRFSKFPICVGCRYWSHLQRRTNDCDWNPDRQELGEERPRRRTSKKATSLDRDGYISTGSSTAEDSHDSDGPVPPKTEEHQDTPKDTAEKGLALPQEQADVDVTTDEVDMDFDYENHAVSRRRSQRPLRDTQPAPSPREASSGLAQGRGRQVTQHPRMQEWEFNEGRLYDSSGKYALAWSAPYSTGREPFGIGPNLSITQLPLRRGEIYSWKAESNQFRTGYILGGEIDLQVNGHATGTLTQGAVFKIPPGDTCKIENRCIVDASILVHVIGNYIRLAAD